MVKVNNKAVPIKRFTDGTLNIKGNPELNHGTVLISWHYESDSEYMIVAFLTQYYQARCNKVVLYLPYVPNARMDRMENRDDILTMKYFGKLINNLNFEKVYVMDVHSSVAIASIDRVWGIKTCIVDNVAKKVEEIVGDEVIMFFPDEGAMKRYRHETDRRFAYGMKDRDWKTGQILGLNICGINADDVKGKTFLLRDDICGKGTTAYYAAKKLKEMGAANVYMYVTHCENTVACMMLLHSDVIEKMYTTNSICTLDNDKIEIIPVDLVPADREVKNDG